MEVLSSRVLLRPTDFEQSFQFYAETLGLHVYREWGSGSTRGVVFFLGGGFLELSGSSGSLRETESWSTPPLLRSEVVVFGGTPTGANRLSCPACQL